jgi:hypothetical protein
MKRIFLWINYYKEHPEVGTTPKVMAEIETLRSFGFEVTYTAYLDNGVAIYDNEDRQVAFHKYFCRNSYFLAAFRREYLTGIARKYLRENTFDYFLLRINCINRSYFKMLQEMKSQGAFVMMESLSYYPNMDFGNVKKASYMMISKSLRKHQNDLKTVVDLMLTEGVLDDFYSIPCVEFGMGINVDNYKKHSYLGNKDELNLLMVGCDSVYHGTDRIIKSLREYYNHHVIRNIKLHLVGDILSKDKKLIEKVGLGDYIICYGRQHGKKLDAIFDKCNIALGPLAQHRIEKKDTGLKTKEYFARGICYLYTGNEVKIDSDYPYILQLEDNEDLIDFKKVISFYDGIKEDMSYPEKMREKARQVFSWKEIFERVFSKVNQIKA